MYTDDIATQRMLVRIVQRERMHELQLDFCFSKTEGRRKKLGRKRMTRRIYIYATPRGINENKRRAAGSKAKLLYTRITIGQI